MSIGLLHPGRAPSRTFFAALLTKLAKHLALIACFAIVGQATGRTFAGPRAIFLIVLAAASIFAAARSIKARGEKNLRNRWDSP